jgi:hypothetical protein
MGSAPSVRARARSDVPGRPATPRRTAACGGVTPSPSSSMAHSARSIRTRRPRRNPRPSSSCSGGERRGLGLSTRSGPRSAALGASQAGWVGSGSGDGVVTGSGLRETRAVARRMLIDLGDLLLPDVRGDIKRINCIKCYSIPAYGRCFAGECPRGDRWRCGVHAAVDRADIGRMSGPDYNAVTQTGSLGPQDVLAEAVDGAGWSDGPRSCVRRRRSWQSRSRNASSVLWAEQFRPDYR